MNLYGEYGNIKILEHHLKKLDNTVIIDNKTINEEFNLNDYDFIYMGSGTEKNQELVLKDFIKHKEELIKYIKSDKYALFTGNSYEILGSKIDDIEALNVSSFIVERTKDRKTDDVIMDSEYIQKKVVGFINKMTNIKNNDKPLFNVIFGIGEDENNKIDGFKDHNLYGTHIIGPILVRNPYFLDLIIKGIYSSKGQTIEKTQLYSNEENGYELVLSELEKRMKG